MRLHDRLYILPIFERSIFSVPAAFYSDFSCIFSYCILFKKMSWKELLRSIVVITIFLLPLAGCSVDYNKNIDTSSWKTYRNDKYGFEFKYPNDWVLNEGRTSSMLYVSFSSPDYNQSFEYRGGDFPQRVITKGGELYLNIDSLAGMEPYDFQKLKNELQRMERVATANEIKIGGEGAIYHTRSNSKDSSDAHVHFLRQNDYSLAFIFGISSASSEKKIHQNIFDQVLRTFRFLPGYEPRKCLDGITQAKSSETGQILEFPTNCLPPNWEKINKG